MKKITFSFLGVSLLLSIASCSKGTISAVQETNSNVKTEFNEILAAELYTNNCGGCHKLQPREKYTAKQWKKIVPEMAKKAKLNSDQEAQILQFVLLNPKPE